MQNVITGPQPFPRLRVFLELPSFAAQLGTVGESMYSLLPLLTLESSPNAWA
jgi:hypothetical protein